MRHGAFGTAVAAVVVVASAGAALAQEAVRVESITFEGNRRYSAETLKYSMRTKEGRTLDRDLLARDVDALRDFFEEIRLEETATPAGIRLVFHVSENPVVSEVTLLGVDQVQEADLKPLVETKVGYPLAKFRVDNDARLLERAYRQRGYHFAEVRPEILEVEGTRRVVFRIVEGPEVLVDEVRFDGNASIPSSRLLKVMLLRPSGLFSPHPFVERRLEEDRVALARLYRDEGFLDVRVVVRDVSFRDDREEAVITFAVEEGRPWALGEVQVVGGTGVPDRESVVERARTLVPGSRWNRREVERALQAIREELSRQGFVEMRVTDEGIPRAEGGIQDLRIQIDEGRRITLRSIDVSGNVVTRDKVILREFSVVPGEPLDYLAVIKSSRRVMDTGYFDSVVPLIPPGDDPDRRDIDVQVVERSRTSQFRFGAGVSSDSGLFATLAVSWQNFDITDWPERWSDLGSGRAFKGAGQRLDLSLQPGTGVSEYRLAFTEPWVADRPVLLGFDIFAWQSRQFLYDHDRSGVTLLGERRWLVPRRDLDDSFSVGLRPRWETVRVSGIDDEDAPPNIFAQEGSNTIHGLALLFGWTRLDQAYATERGWRVSYSAELVGSALGGDFDFHKHVLQAERTYTLWLDDDDRAHTFQVRGNAGVAGPLDDSGAVPLTERFLGGGSSGLGRVRGFEYGGIGPRGEGNPATHPGRVAYSRSINDGHTMGGEAVASGTLEYGFPLVADLLRGAVFVDAANLAENTGGLRSDWRSSAGFGILIKVPFLGQIPLRFDFGFPLSKEQGDQTRVVSFEFTTYF